MLPLILYWQVSLNQLWLLSLSVQCSLETQLLWDVRGFSHRMDGCFSGEKTQTLNLLELQLKESILWQSLMEESTAAEHEEKDITQITVNQQQ